MMSGKNSIGFLLNDNGSDVTGRPNLTSKAAASNFGQHSTTSHLLQQQRLQQQQPSTASLPQYILNSHSRSSSNSSTPSQTPQLIRSDSSDSRGSVSATPSPLTPSYTSFDQAHHHNHTFTGYSHTTSPHQHHSAQKTLPGLQYASTRHSSSSSLSSAKMDDPINSLYPPIPDATVMSAYPIPPQLGTGSIPLHQDPNAMLYRSSNSPASEPSRMSTVSAASTTTTANNAAKSAAPKKNQYPCPMAKQFNCNDFFTTSGHAARHAKKHTGKKDAFCPECNKAFTRKDNMEQHRRTHQNGRGAGRSTDDKVKKSTKAPAKKATIIKPEPALEAAVVQELQQQQQQQQQVQDELAVAAQLQAITAAQQQQLDAVLLPSASGPYFVNTLDPGPISSLPMPPMNDMSAIRPSLHRSNMTSSLDYIPPMLIDPETLNYSYPSPGLSNGLNSLALAASEHRRLSEEKESRSPPSESVETPPTESP